MNHIELKEYPPMMDVQQVAGFLRTGKQSVYRAAKQPGFPAVMIGGKLRIMRDKLMEWFESHSIASI